MQIGKFQRCKDAKLKGKFVVFEGPHVSGKTMQAKMLCEHLQNTGVDAHYTKEPYCDDLIPLINKYSTGDLIHSPVLMHLLAADRYIHVSDIISWMERGMFVICDRYVLSSLVYQQMQGIPLNIIKETNSFAINPDLMFFVNVPLKERLARVKRTHKEPRTFFLRDDKLVEEQELYQTLINNWDEGRYGKIAIINGHEDINKVHRIVVNLVSEKLT